MIKNLILGFVLLQSIWLTAQNSNCQSKIKKEVIDIIKNYPSNDLIPYYDKSRRKWGYMDKKTSKKITAPLFSREVFFNPNIAFSLEVKENVSCYANIYGSKKNYDIFEVKEIVYDPNAIKYTGDSPERGDWADNPNVKAFEVNEKGKLLFVNPKYSYYGVSTKIRETFYFKDQYYAIINDGGYTIINQNDEIVEGFYRLKSFPILKDQYSSDTDAWFYIRENEDKYILKGLLSGIEKYKVDDYRSGMLGDLGYALLELENAWGVMDLTTLEWKVPIAKENNFSNLLFSSLVPMKWEVNKNISDIEFIKENRKNADIYIATFDNKIYDLEMNLYLPNE